MRGRRPRRVTSGRGVPVLRDWLPRAHSDGLAPVALRALATLRRDEAFDFLLELIRDAEEPTACDAVVALAGRCDETLRSRLREAAAARPRVARTVERSFAQ